MALTKEQMIDFFKEAAKIYGGDITISELEEKIESRKIKFKENGE